MKKVIVVLLFGLWGGIALAQESSNVPVDDKMKVAVVDSVLEKIWIAFDFDSLRGRKFNDRIRITDLTKEFGKYGHYHRKVYIIIVNKIPLNLNNGEYRDVILNDYELKNDTLSIKAFFCTFQQTSSKIRVPYLGTFVFKINGRQVRVIKSDVMMLSNWSGHLGGWE